MFQQVVELVVLVLEETHALDECGGGRAGPTAATGTLCIADFIWRAAREGLVDVGDEDGDERRR